MLPADTTTNAPARKRAADRVEEARRLCSPCVLCERRCRAERATGARGFCGLSDGARVFRTLVHYGIEYELVPAYAVYLAGCNLRCGFCTAAEWNDDPSAAEPLDAMALQADMGAALRSRARTLLIVGGEPTVSLPGVLELIAAAPEGLRVVLDSNMYFSTECAGLLDRVVDTYVGDLKFGPGPCASGLSDAPAYFETVTRNLIFAEERASLIVRHVLMPGHFDCCLRPVLEWLRRTLRAPRLSLRGDYLPPETARAPEVPSGYVSHEEYARALALARATGVELIQ
jgi:putative pyruvate formate lyase activating enzyme